MKTIFTIIAIIFTNTICFAEEDNVILESINSRFHKLLPVEKTEISVTIQVSEFNEITEQLALKLESENDTTLARQLRNLSAKLKYKTSTNKYLIELSPLTIKKDSKYLEDLIQIKKGYIQTVQGGFEQIKALLFYNIFEGGISNPSISYNDSETIIEMTKKTGKEKYQIKDDYKQIVMSGHINSREIHSTMETTELDNKLFFSHIDMKIQSMEMIIDFVYSTVPNKRELLKSYHKIKTKVMNMNLTLEYNDWEFK